MKDTTLTVRPYCEETDLKKLSDIWFEASMLAHAFLGEARLREQRTLIETIYLPQAETWVACQLDEPAGFISLLDTFIGGLFVSPRQHKRGIGRLLVDHALHLKGGLELEVYLDNAQACAFYHSLGFKEVSRRDRDDQGLPFRNARLRLNI